MGQEGTPAPRNRSTAGRRVPSFEAGVSGCYRPASVCTAPNGSCVVDSYVSSLLWISWGAIGQEGAGGRELRLSSALSPASSISPGEGLTQCSWGKVTGAWFQTGLRLLPGPAGFAVLCPGKAGAEARARRPFTPGGWSCQSSSRSGCSPESRVLMARA